MLGLLDRISLPERHGRVDLQIGEEVLREAYADFILMTRNWRAPSSNEQVPVPENLFPSVCHAIRPWRSDGRDSVQCLAVSAVQIQGTFMHQSELISCATTTLVAKRSRVMVGEDFLPRDSPRLWRRSLQR